MEIKSEESQDKDDHNFLMEVDSQRYFAAISIAQHFKEFCDDTWRKIRQDKNVNLNFAKYAR